MILHPRKASVLEICPQYRCKGREKKDIWSMNLLDSEKFPDFEAFQLSMLQIFANQDVLYFLSGKRLSGPKASYSDLY